MARQGVQVTENKVTVTKGQLHYPSSTIAAANPQGKMTTVAPSTGFDIVKKSTTARIVGLLTGRA